MYDFLQFVDFVYPQLYETEMGHIGQHAEAWLAAYRMTREGRGFVGVPPALDDVFGARSARRRLEPALADL